MSIRKALESAIRNSGISAKELQRRTGVPQTTITRFLLGKDMRLAAVDKLAAFIGLKVEIKAKTSEAPGKKAKGAK